MCLFIHYLVSDRHTIICVSELVILFLIKIENKGKKQCLPNDMISFASAARYIAFSYNSYTCTDLSFGITEEHNKNRVVGSVLEP